MIKQIYIISIMLPKKKKKYSINSLGCLLWDRPSFFYSVIFHIFLMSDKIYEFCYVRGVLVRLISYVIRCESINKLRYQSIILDTCVHSTLSLARA